MKAEYPKWVYHQTAGARLLAGVEQHRTLPPGWHESPYDVHHVEAPQDSEEAPVASAEFEARFAAETAPIVAPVPPVPDAERKQYWALSARSAIEEITKVAAFGATALTRAREVEEHRPGGARKTVLKAIADALTAALVAA